jgi:Glycine-rich domain-containing protein-like
MSNACSDSSNNFRQQRHGSVNTNMNADTDSDRDVGVSSSTSPNEDDGLSTITKIQQKSDDLSVDLVELCQEHIKFLQHMHEGGWTVLASASAPLVATTSLRRYKDYWLPLVAEAYDIEYNQSNTTSLEQKQSFLPSLTEQLVPPCDVAWLWHCHRLAPARYKSYIRKEYSNKYSKRVHETILNCNDPKIPFQIVSGNDITRKLWNDMYPTEPFDLTIKNGFGTITSVINSHKHIVKNEDRFVSVQNSITDASLLLDGYNLLLASIRQKSFWYQVSIPCYQDIDYIDSVCVTMYKQFLQLKGTNKDETTHFFIVPTYSIDLTWHTHMLSSVPLYDKDCTTIMGHTLNHDDNLGDRSADSKLMTSWNLTCDLWYRVYGTNYRKMGGYRGEPPKSYYQQAYNGLRKQQKQLQRQKQTHGDDIQYTESQQINRQQQQQEQTSFDKNHDTTTSLHRNTVSRILRVFRAI